MTFFIYSVWHLSMCAIIFFGLLLMCEKKGEKRMKMLLTILCAISFMMTGPIVVARNSCTSTSHATNCDAGGGQSGYMDNNPKGYPHCYANADVKCYMPNYTPNNGTSARYDSNFSANSCS